MPSCATVSDYEEDDSRGDLLLANTLWPDGHVHIVFKPIDSYPQETKLQLVKNLYTNAERLAKDIERNTPLRFSFYDSFDSLTASDSRELSFSGLVGGKAGSFGASGHTQLKSSISFLPHELGHVVNIFHSHQRPDRDLYINVYWENISEAGSSNFEIFDSEFAQSHNWDTRVCLLYTSPSPRDATLSRMPSSA